MKRLFLRLVVAFTTFGVGVVISITWAVYQEPAEASAPAIPSVSPVIPDRHSGAAAYRFSAETYSWQMRVDTPPGWRPIFITGPNNPCELKDDPDYSVPDKVVMLCAEWDGRGNVFEWLRERGERDAHGAPPDKGTNRTHNQLASRH
jgi:hypothetical protein